MRAKRAGLSCLSGLLLVAAGCWTTEPSLKPPPHPEEYTIPPQDDSRFSAPIEYPKGTLNQDTIKKPEPTDPSSPASASRFGGPGPGMRGY